MHIPCCGSLSSCRRSLGRVYGWCSVQNPQWCGGSHPPPGRSCPGWSPPEELHAPQAPQRCCTPPPDNDRMREKLSALTTTLHESLSSRTCEALAQGWANSALRGHFHSDFSSNPNQTHLNQLTIVFKTTIRVQAGEFYQGWIKSLHQTLAHHCSSLYYQNNV